MKELKETISSDVKKLQSKAANIFFRADYSKFRNEVQEIQELWKHALENIKLLEDKRDCKTYIDQAKTIVKDLCDNLKDQTFEPAKWVQVETGSNFDQYALQLDTGCILAVTADLNNPVFIPGIRIREVKGKYYLDKNSHLYT